MGRSSPMRAFRLKWSRSSSASSCGPRARMIRSKRSGASSSRWPGECRNAARSSRIRTASNSRSWTPIRGASSGCGCAACRRLPVGARSARGKPAREPPVPDFWLLRADPGARVDAPLCRLAQELAALTGWRRYGLGFLLGALLAASLPPVDLMPLVFVAFPALLWLDEGSAGSWASARLGYAVGLGFFAAGLYWIAAALFVDITRFWWALPFAVFGLPAFLALFSAAVLGLLSYATRRLRLTPTARVCLFAVLWSAAEWLRGHVLTGFPWNLVGYVWSGGFPGALAMLQSTAWVGIYGLSFLTVLAASLPALLGGTSLLPLPRRRRAAPAVAAALLLLVPAASGAIRLGLLPTRPTDTWLRLVQPSVPQGIKWDPEA